MGSLEFSTYEVGGIYSAIMGMRNPHDSWNKSDTLVELSGKVLLGENDLTLAKTLSKSGPEHRKYLRQIQVWADVIMPRYWWQEADTYKFGTKNSCSTMHSLTKQTFTIHDFYIGKTPSPDFIAFLNTTIRSLNKLRENYLSNKNEVFFAEIKRLLPECFLQLRTWNTNYEELMNMYHQRKHHRMKEEWGAFCKWCESLPYFKELCIDPVEK